MSEMDDVMARLCRLEVAAFGAPRGPATVRRGPGQPDPGAASTARAAGHAAALRAAGADPALGLRRLVAELRRLGRRGGDAELREAVRAFRADPWV